ncbi:ESX-1 secretion-associated protein [Mycolicibacterium peregrinum]|uniref:ESX-1 secretion-associated protein n=1 Tax=Mycolicibacterium peregrinum TaxID=43304 RepID=UPI003AADAE9B
MPEPLKVDPSELHVTAGNIDSHAAVFAQTHRSTHEQAGQVALGAGPASAALPAMLAAWESDAISFGEHFTKHAEGHRAAATAYSRTDANGGERVGDASSAL